MTKATKHPSEVISAPEAETPSTLLTPEQLAIRLSVKTSWIREKTRTRARRRDSDPLPTIFLGKYVRFRWTEVSAWLERQSRDAKS